MGCLTISNSACHQTNRNINCSWCFPYAFEKLQAPENLYHIVSDNDRKFRSNFWEILRHASKMELRTSSSRHSKTNGSSEIMNRMMENYIRCYCSYYQDEWYKLLPTAEFSYSLSVSNDLGISPYHMDFRWALKTLLKFLSSNELPAQSLGNFKLKLKTFLEDAWFL